MKADNKQNEKRCLAEKEIVTRIENKAKIRLDGLIVLCVFDVYYL